MTTKEMTMSEMTSLLESVIQQSHNDLITMAVIILIGLVVFFIPFYTLYSKSKKQAAIDATKERAMYLEIVQSNTDALTSLKHSLETNNEVLANTLLDVENTVIGGVSKMDSLLKKQNEFKEEFDTFVNDEELAHQHCASELAKVTRTQEKILNKVEDIGDKVSVLKPDKDAPCVDE